MNYKYLIDQIVFFVISQLFLFSSSTSSTKIDGELVEDETNDEEEEDNEEIASSEEKLISNVPAETNLPTQRSTPGYVNIRRTRPTTTTEISR